MKTSPRYTKNGKMIYNYTGFHGCACICELEIIDTLVIVSEMPENEGTSVTNFAEQLATLVCQEFKIEPKHLIWIEHYPERGDFRDFPESYDLVNFNLNGKGIFSNPRWTGISPIVVDAFRATQNRNTQIEKSGE